MKSFFVMFAMIISVVSAFQLVSIHEVQGLLLYTHSHWYIMTSSSERIYVVDLL
jgi:hypothetical protein